MPAAPRPPAENSTPLPLLWTEVPLHDDAFDLLRGRARLSGPGVPAALAANPKFEFEAAAAAIVGSRRCYDAAAFAAAPQLQVIARTGIGYDNVDVPAASAAGVCAVNTPDAPTESTAEFTIGLIFAVVRRIVTADRHAKAGRWQFDPEVMGFDLADKTLGLVGFGRVGRRVAEMARVIRMRVCAFDPFVAASVIAGAGGVPCASLPEMLACSRVLSLHAPNTPLTRGMIGAAQLAQLPRGAVLINTARGPIIDEAAVLAALDSGQLGGAGLDVWETEPVRPEHPLWRHPKVVATPHMAAYTDEGRSRSHVAAATHVLAVLGGEAPATLLDPAMWPHRRR